MHPLLHPAGRIVPYIIVHQINQYRAFRIIRKAGPVKEASLQPRNEASYAKKRQKKAGEEQHRSIRSSASGNRGHIRQSVTFFIKYHN